MNASTFCMFYDLMQKKKRCNSRTVPKSGVTKIETVTYYLILMDRHTSRLKVIFSYRYHLL